MGFVLAASSAELRLPLQIDQRRKGAISLQLKECEVTDPRLTPAQQEVASLIKEGKSNPTIAAMPETATSTVKKQVQQALNATGTDNRVMLALNC